MSSYQIVCLTKKSEIESSIICLGKYLYNQSLNNPIDIAILANKYAKCGTVYAIVSEDSIKGLCAFYANNSVSKRAFLSMIVVSETERRRGYGKALIECMISTCKNKGMISIDLEVAKQNEAVEVYKKLGFCLINETENSFFYRLAI